MKALIVMAASGMAVGGGLYVGGIASRGHAYDLPIAEARSRLTNLSLSPDTLAIAGGSDVDRAVAVAGASDGVEWSVPMRGGRAGKFIAELRAEGPSRTRVITSYVSGSPAPSFTDRLTSTRFFRGYADANFDEDVAASLEGRPVNQRKARYEFATRAAADPRQLRELGLASASMFNDVASRPSEATDGSDEFAPSGRAAPVPKRRD